MYCVYILKSIKDNGFYIGYTSNIEKRLDYHIQGFSKATRYRLPAVLVYKELFESKSTAIKRENQLKKYKSKKYI